MKKFLPIFFAVFLLVLTTDDAHSQSTYEGDYSPGAAAAGVGASRHNLGSTGRFTTTEATTEICIFCHTPHFSTAGTGPIWNRSLAASANYVAYGVTLAKTEITIVPGSTSLACLSCHDGVTTIDVLVNAPGKGGVTAGGADLGWTFLRIGALVPDYMTEERLVIGTSLTNDHPVSVDYQGGEAASLRLADTTISTINLTGDLNMTTQFWGDITSNYWSVKGAISATATISDLLRDGRVECSSCHDPHFKNQSAEEIFDTYSTDSSVWGVEVDGLFLRRVGGNTGSGVCRTCHQK